MNLYAKIKNLLKTIIKPQNTLFYLSGSETLPRAYSTEEEYEKLLLLENGDESVKKDLIEHNLRLVVYIARKFDNTKIELDDLISVGSVGLIKAVNTFNLDKKIKLATYASRCIENEILMHLRKISKVKGEISLDEPLNVDYEGNELLLSDVLGTDPEIVYKQTEEDEERKILKRALERLNFRERQIMHLRFGLGGDDELTQKEVADLLGISQSYISRLEKKIVERLKKEFFKSL